MKLGIIGIAKSGISAAKKAKELGYEVFLTEYKTLDKLKIDVNDLEDLTYEVGGHSDKIMEYPLIVVSPGVPLDSPIIKKLQDNGNELISEIEFGYRVMNHTAKIIAVTGSNGKSTTVSLIHYMLDRLGYKTALAGNIGIPFTALPIEKEYYDYIVLELSSFQLDLVKHFRANVALLLNITPDHLNRYESFDAYSLAKFNIFKSQIGSDVAIIYDNDNQIKKYSYLIKSKIIKFGFSSESRIKYVNGNIIFNDFSINFNEITLKGQHNILNIMACLLVINSIHIDVKNQVINKIIQDFKGLEHRLEFVRSINNIKFYNDSKATNTDSVHYALSAFSKKVIIILGGSDKGEDYSVLFPDLNRYAKKVFLIGATKEKMNQQLKSFHNKEKVESLEEAVKKAYEYANSSDTILLSPACASFDSFNNFEDRGNFFKKVVWELS